MRRRGRPEGPEGAGEHSELARAAPLRGPCNPAWHSPTRRAPCLAPDRPAGAASSQRLALVIRASSSAWKPRGAIPTRGHVCANALDGVSPQLPKGLATLSGCCSYSRGHKVLRTEELPRSAGDVRMALPISLNPFPEQPGAEHGERGRQGPWPGQG